MIKTFLGSAAVPADFATQVRTLTLRFFRMIAPLIPASVASTLWIPTTDSKPYLPSQNNNNWTSAQGENLLLSNLWTIIDVAARISLAMCREETIYYVDAPAKNSVWDPKEMSVMNPRAINEAGEYKEYDEVPLVRIVCFPGIVAYRPGNGRAGGEGMGFRVRRICRAEVVLEWGVERKIGGPPGSNANANANREVEGKREGVVTLREAIAASKPSWMAGLLEGLVQWPVVV